MSLRLVTLRLLTWPSEPWWHKQATETQHPTQRMVAKHYRECGTDAADPHISYRLST